MRLIDADALIEDIKEFKELEPKYNLEIIYKGVSCDFAIKAIEEASTVDAEPVRHGYWIKEKIVTQTTAGIQLVTWAYVCSECKMRLSIVETKKNYCPYCGAKMDKEEQHE